MFSKKYEVIFMAVRKIRTDNDEILTKRCKEVTEINDKIKLLLDDMEETLRAATDAAGLAACQIGVLKQLVVIDTGDRILKLINPKILSQSGFQECVEGCLSFPNRIGRTMRPQKVTIQALDENGELFEMTGEGELAKCFCHEIDHLNGKVFLEEVIEFIDLHK